MTKKTKRIIIIALALCCIVLSIWAFVNYQTKRKAKEQYNNALAQRFDEAIDAAYPLLENYAITLQERADSIEKMARMSKEDTCNSYSDAFAILWRLYTRTEQGIKCYNMIEEYEYFTMSPVIEMLVKSGTKRKNESDGIRKLTSAGILLKEPYMVGYDSIMNASKEARQYISDCLEAIGPYHSKQNNIQAWRDLMLRK